MQARISATKLVKAVSVLLALSGVPATHAQTVTPSATAIASAASSPQITAKKTGITRIGVALPKIQLAQGDTATAESLRATEVQYLQGPAMEIVVIKSMIPIQIAAELKEHDCDLLLYTNLAEKPPSSSGGLFRKAMPMASMLPMAGMLGGVAGAVTTSAASVALSSAAGLATNVKAKSEMTLTYRLVRVSDGVEIPVVENTLHAKATRDGEDIISPMVEQTATAVITRAAAK